MAASADTMPRAEYLHNHSRHHDQRVSQRGKRALPSPGPVVSSLRTSFSQLSTQDDSKRPFSTTASSSTTPSSTPGRGVRTVGSELDSKSPHSTSEMPSTNQDSKPSLPLLQIPRGKQRSDKNGQGAHGRVGGDKDDDDDDDDDSYFGDILDKYCHSDDDPASPSTASPTSPFSTGHAWADFRSPQPPTPPVTSSRHRFDYPAIVPPRRATPLRNSSAAAANDSSVESSPMLAASARFNTYLQSSSNRSSRDSLSLNGAAAASSNQSSPAPSPGIRAYSRRPVPVPGFANSSATSSPRASATSLVSYQQGHNYSSQDLRDTRPEPPTKDGSRQLQKAQRHISSSNSQSSQHSSSFPTAIDETTKRNRTTSVTSFVSSSGSVNPYADNATRESSSPYADNATREISSPYADNATRETSSPYADNATRERSNSNQSQFSSMSGPTRNRHSSQQQQQQYSQYQQHEQRQQQQQHTYYQGQKMQDRDGQQHNQQQWQQHREHHRDSQTNLAESPHYQTQRSSQPSSLGLTPSEMLSRRFEERAGMLGQGPLSTVSVNSTSAGKKSALVRSSIARTRSKDTMGPRKVVFGDMITIVTVERAETPPPVPTGDKKKKKKKTKKGSSKTGPHPDPEYDEDYYNTPYTPEPTEVVITQAPWIGNPNYDEEKRNSSFYYEDEYEYEGDDYEYEASQDTRQRLDDDEDEDDDDDDDEDEDTDDYGSGTSSSKKKGGMFKFKRAVNRLLRN
ncbi:hypothetical protein BGZ99_000864 [Dissophora globulifera]|uniref:Uncharacterized protein n=1 Tax=Dissophora globulifera TaxID=979702 RepID=A0A9P6QZN7_9FUNG|nr:hypothetical protein BGZ99_000864 [Dissophora globulifera]